MTSRPAAAPVSILLACAVASALAIGAVRCASAPAGSTPAAASARVWLRMDVYAWRSWSGEFECDSMVVEARAGQTFGPPQGTAGWPFEMPVFRVLELGEGPRVRLWFSRQLAVHGRPWPRYDRPRTADDSLAWLGETPLTFETPTFDAGEAVTLRLLATPGAQERRADFTYPTGRPSIGKPPAPVRCPFRPLRPLQAPQPPPLRGWRSGGTTVRIEGRCHVNEQGRVTEVLLTRSLPGADSAILETVRGWRFLPQIEGGSPVAAWYPFGFLLQPE